MSRSQANLKFLYERRDQLRVELEAARARLEEVNAMIRQMGGELPSVAPEMSLATTKPRRGGLKETVIDLLEEAGEAGLTTNGCVLGAREKGIKLQPPSVSSPLSRLKADGVLMYDGERYRLKRFTVSVVWRPPTDRVPAMGDCRCWSEN